MIIGFIGIMLSIREVGKNIRTETLSGDEAIKFLAKVKFSSRDITKEPNLDILVALLLYPNSTYDKLLDLGFERYKQIWGEYTPNLIEQGLMQESPDGKYSLTDDGIAYVNSQLKTEGLVSKIVGYLT